MYWLDIICIYAEWAQYNQWKPTFFSHLIVLKIYDLQMLSLASKQVSKWLSFTFVWNVSHLIWSVGLLLAVVDTVAGAGVDFIVLHSVSIDDQTQIHNKT